MVSAYFRKEQKGASPAPFYCCIIKEHLFFLLLSLQGRIINRPCKFNPPNTPQNHPRAARTGPPAVGDNTRCPRDRRPTTNPSTPNNVRQAWGSKHILGP